MSLPNRLAAESSPYLLQHAHNPVDWYPWGEEAFSKAKVQDRPVFLSIGYSSCHWCHVMERESFEDEATARLLNDHFVSIKVDREERPDVDDVYMSAVQAMGNRGGWPLSAFLFPDGRPFFGGTYFPPDGRGGRPGFGSLLVRLAEAWRQRRSDLEEEAARLLESMGSEAKVAAGVGRRPLTRELLDGLSSALHRSFDTRHGGFGGAPKFPPHLALEWLLVSAERQGPAMATRASPAAMADATLEAMALGGIHDHVGGGFHRYSTDERWLLPHFEKMLTDNALLLGLYARAHARSGRALFGRTARGIGDYLLSEMRGPEGGFYAGTDADSEGEEGRFFVWSLDDVRAALGPDAPLVEAAYG
ncbi:MAG TPA: thioredoxin domain-containing protein, partial [Thermoanaerobaculia bacterium]